MRCVLEKCELCIFICYMIMPEILMTSQTNIIDDHSVINSAVEILESCSIHDGSSILVAGGLDANEVKRLTSRRRSVLVLDQFDLLNYENVQNTIQALVISPNSANDLSELLQQVKNSSIWNNLRYNIILSNAASDNNCSSALSYLFSSWKGDLLNSVYLCAVTEINVKAYTYNPYTDRAPKPWSYVTKFKDNGDHWYLYATEYLSDHVTCSSLFFDKTLNLDKYKGVKVVTHIPPIFNTTNILHDYPTNSKKRFDIKIISILHKKMNISYAVMKNPEYGAFDEHGDPIGVDKYLSQDVYDILIDHRYLMYTKGLVQSTFTLGIGGVSFIIEHRPNVSILLQIVSYFKPIVILFSIVVLGATIAVLKLSVEESYDTAVLEVFRLFLNGPLLRAPINSSPRIYLFTILVFILVMQSILQSKILSFIMVPKSDNINTFAELEQHQEYTIYCKHGYRYLLPPNIAKRSIVENSYIKVFNNSKSAFIWEDLINLSIAKERNLHMSKQIIGKHHLVHRTRRSWPLIRRVNEIYMRLFENGISNRERKMARFYITKNHPDDHIHHHNAQTVLTMRHIEFTFKILIFGLICSFFSFLIEIKVWSFFPSLLQIKRYFDQYFQ